MKKIVAIVLALMMIMSFATVVSAENDVTVSLDVSSKELSGAGKVTLSFSITNNSSERMENVTLYSGDEVVDEFGNISAGATETYSVPFNISESQLGQKITLDIRYILGSNTHEIQKSFTVNKKSVNAVVAGSVSVNKDTVSAGESVQFSFLIENQGDVDISDVKLTAAPLNNGKQIGDTFSLGVGKTKKITYTVELSSDVTVKPQITYTVDGETKTSSLSSVSVKVNDLQMEVKITAGNTSINPGETIPFDIEIINTGKIDFANIKIYSPYGEEIEMDRSTLSAGSSMVQKHDLLAVKTGKVQYTVEAEDKNGNNVKVESNAIEVAVAGSTENGSDAKLEMSIEINTDKLASTGEVTLLVTVKNPGLTPITGIKVVEQTLGEIGSIGTLTNGEETISYTFKFEGTQEVIYTFEASGTDYQGSVVSTLTQTKITPVENNGGGNTIQTLIIIIIIVVVIIIGLAIAFVIVYKKDKKGGRPKGDGPTRGGAAKGAAIAKGASGAKPKPSAPGAAKQQHKPQNTPQPKKTAVKPKRNYGDRNNF